MQPLVGTAGASHPPMNEDEKFAYSIFTKLLQKINGLYTAAGKEVIPLHDQNMNLCRDSIAYFVEGNKQQEPMWKELLPAFIQEIENVQGENTPEKALCEVFCRLQDAIDTLYATSLHTKIQECNATKNEEKKKTLLTRFTYHECLKRLNTKIRSQGKCPVIDGIPRDELPQWYLAQHTISKKSN